MRLKTNCCRNVKTIFDATEIGYRNNNSIFGWETDEKKKRERVGESQKHKHGWNEHKSFVFITQNRLCYLLFGNIGHFVEGIDEH